MGLPKRIRWLVAAWLAAALGCGGRAVGPTGVDERYPAADAEKPAITTPDAAVEAGVPQTPDMIPEESPPRRVTAVDGGVEVSIKVVPEVASCIAVQGLLFRATALLSDGSEKDVSSQVTWSSSVDTVVLGQGLGYATCLSTGTSTISATLGAIRGELEFHVDGAKIVDFSMGPSRVTRLNRSEAFELFANYDNGRHVDVTEYATYDSSDTKVLAFGSIYGRADVVSAGTAQVTAKIGQTTVASVTVVASDVALASIAVTPATLELAFPDEMGNFIAMGTLADGSQIDISQLAAWSSGPTHKVDVSSGMVTTRQVGAETVFASLEGVTGSSSVDVLLGTPSSVYLEDTGLRLPKGFDQMLLATGQYSGGRTTDATSIVTWHSLDPSIASFDGAANGEITGHKSGTTACYVTVGALKSNLQTVTITDAALSSIAVYHDTESPTINLKVADTSKVEAFGIFDDGWEVEIASQVTWSTDDASIATVGDSSRTQRLVTAVAKGTTALTARFGAISATVTIVVAP